MSRFLTNFRRVITGARVGEVFTAQSQNAIWTHTRSEGLDSQSDAHSDEDSIFEIVEEEEEGYVEVTSSGLQFDLDESDDEAVMNPRLLCMQQHIDELNSQIHKERDQARLTEDHIAQLQFIANSMQQKCTSEQARADEAERRVKVVTTHARNFEHNAEKMRLKLAELEDLLAKSRGQIELLHRKKEDMETENELLNTTLQALQKELQYLLGNGESRIQALQGRTCAAECKAADLETRIASQISEIATLCEEKMQSDLNTNELEAEVDLLRQDVKVLKVNLDFSQERADKDRERVLELEELMKTLRSELKESRAQVENGERALKDMDRIATENQLAIRQHVETKRTTEESFLAKVDALGKEILLAETALIASQTRAEEGQKKLIEAQAHAVVLQNHLDAMKKSREEDATKWEERLAQAERNTADALRSMEVATGQVSVAMKQTETAERRANDAETQARHLSARLEKESAEAVRRAKAVGLQHANVIRQTNEQTRVLREQMQKAKEQYEAGLKACLNCADCNASLDHRIAFNFVVPGEGTSVIKSYCNKCY